MGLNEQIHIYSVDTSAFYTPAELAISCRINKLGRLKKRISSPKRVDRIERVHPRWRHGINAELGAQKDLLYECFRRHTGVRRLNPKKLNQFNVISVFASTLTRTLGFQADWLYDDIMIVRTYYYDVLKSLVTDGFTLNGERYVVFTASAGQIRTKKTMFIKEAVLRQHECSLMCGLTLERINARGGININKYLAYLALCNSATDVWQGFQIDRCIVVDDLTTHVRGEVDYIGVPDFTITRQSMDVPVCHTDGCGLVLPSVSKKNFMVRLPWIKGLLAVCDFKKFITEKNGSPLITDIYGRTYDVVADNIRIIFFKSQFKMHKYYESWDEYKLFYKQYRCMAGICNTEESRIPKARFNYQMLQTLVGMTDGELEALCRATNEKVQNIATDRRTMLELFGATPGNQNKTYFQQALTIYPELLADSYSREAIKQLKRSIVRHARGGRMTVEGRYLFIVPDLYAVCEYLFLGRGRPKGLLGDGEVFCRLYAGWDKLDCLRSPHLSNEHAVRRNAVDEERLGWFPTNALYVSTHDLISKILQFDVDGDKSLVCADRTIVAAAERDAKDFVPLYYEMKKASPVAVCNEEIYRGLIAAYSGGNIGPISNCISKIWNSGQPDIDLIKILVAQNNFVIDYAKTLYKPVLPPAIQKQVSQYARQKVPYFFKYAKGKTGEQVDGKNNSVVNRLERMIVNKHVQFTATNIGCFDYRMLMCDPKTAVKQEIVQTYQEINTKSFYQISNYGVEDREDKYAYYFRLVRQGLVDLYRDPYVITDVLIRHLFQESPTQFKETLWQSFGDIIVDNLRQNISANQAQCALCGVRYERKSNSGKYCKDCGNAHRRAYKTCKDREYRRQTRTNRSVEKS